MPMVRLWIRRTLVVSALSGSSLAVLPAQAQTSPSFAPSPLATGVNAPVGAMMANPYMNPYMNPYLNPMATQQPMTGRDAAVYMYMANSARGGLGSGVISGTRPLPGNATALNAAQPKGRGAKNPNNNLNNAMRNVPTQNGRRSVAEMPDSASAPGAGASRFFNPGPVNNGGAGRYYNRRNTYFNSNGH